MDLLADNGSLNSMRTLGRYIVLEILKVFVPLWVGLSFFPLLAEWAARVFNLKGSALTSLLAYVYKYPSYLQMVFPLTLLIASVVVFRGMNRDREIVAFESFGVRYRDLFKPLLLVVVLCGIPFLWISLELSPRGLRAHYDLYDHIKGRKSRVGQYRQEKIWYRSGDVLYNIGFYDPRKKELLEVSLYEFDDAFQLRKITNAKKAVWTGRNWLLLGGSQVFVSNELEQPGREDFEVLENHIMEEPEDLKRYEFNPEILTQRELYETIKRYQGLGINTAIWETTFHSRFSFLALSFVLLLVALPRTFRFRRSNNMAKDLTFISVFSLFFWIANSIIKTLGDEGRIHPLLATWGLVFVIFIYATINVMRLKLADQSE